VPFGERGGDIETPFPLRLYGNSGQVETPIIAEPTDDWQARQDSSASRGRNTGTTLESSWPQQETDAGISSPALPQLDSVPAKADANPPMSTSMIIGLTLAVALPPAILIGAIIGFLVHRSFF
jgi:hypothetical protein